MKEKQRWKELDDRFDEIYTVLPRSKKSVVLGFIISLTIMITSTSLKLVIHNEILNIIIFIVDFQYHHYPFRK
jgi:hypothetical protein